MARRPTTRPHRPKTIRTPKRGEGFLKALRSGKSVTAACRIGRIARTAAYEWRKGDEAFAKAWDEAIEEGTDGLEDSAHTRAKKSSDTLMIFLLKARRPDKFKERVLNEHTGKDGGAIEVTGDVDRARALAAFIAKTKAGKS